VAPPGNQAANREDKIQPMAMEGPGLLDNDLLLDLVFIPSGSKNNIVLMGQSILRRELRHLGKTQRIGRGLWRIAVFQTEALRSFR